MTSRSMVPEPNHLFITHRVSIPLDDLRFTFSRSSGPGGQNVNKVNTKATLHFDLPKNRTLTEDQKSKIRHRLASRIGSDGVLRIHSSRHRTQNSNREAAIHRLVELLSAALQPTKPRGKTQPTMGSKTRRLEGKKIRSGIKQQRGRVRLDRD